MKIDSGIGTEMTGPNPGSDPGAEHIYVFPVTFAQQRLLFLNQLEPNSTSYSVPWSIRMTGELNVEALERSLNEIVNRHEILRTTFDVIEGQAVQIVGASLQLPLPVVDITSFPDVESEALAAAMNEARSPLDLKNGPLVRTKLLRLGPNDHVLLITTHHIVFDGWSRRILVSDLSALYDAYSAGLPSPLPELPLQYADYAVWQRTHLQGENLENLLNFWKQQLAGAPATLDMPTDRPRPAVQSFRGAVKSFAFPHTLSNEVANASRRFGATPFMTLLAAFQVLLSRYSGQNDIVVGAPIANRNRAEIEGVIGYFANTLALRTSVAGDPTFRDLLKRVKDSALGAYAHQDMPFERLVEELRPERSLSYNPLFQVLFSLQSANRRDFKLRGLQLQPLGGVVGTTAKFDMSFFLQEGADGLTGRIEYNTDLFDGSTIDRMLLHYQTLLNGAFADPDMRISLLPLLTSDELQQVLGDWNATQMEYPSERCVHELFERQAERAPNAVACVFEKDQLTYGELNERANQLAHYLKQRGVGSGRRVGIFVERSLAMMVGLLGIQKAGAAYVPLDPYYPAERLKLVLDDAQVPLLLTQQALLSAMPEHRAEVICLDADWPEIAHQSSSNPVCDAKPEDIVYVIYTSGSTGRPKGVQVPHRAVVNLLSFMARELRMGPDDVFPALASFAFDMCIPELYLALVTGGRTVLVRREMASNGEELAALLRETGATIVHATPTSWSLLLDAGFTAKGLKRAIGAEPLPRELCTRLLVADGSLYNFYGPTETTVWSTFHHFRSVDEPVVLGRPLANTQVYILDKDLQPVPAGVPGEIHIAGDGVTCGYLNLPELTAEKFILDPFSQKPNARMYKTGDMGSFLPDGRIEFLGRVDNQVKIRGFRIELSEIESVLARHPSVQDCVVQAREDMAGDKRLVGYVVPAAGFAIQVAGLRKWVMEHLPEYMVPVAWVEMARLPLSPNGKVDRKNLPAPEYNRPELAGEYQGARTPAEEVMANIWGEVLRVDQVGVHDQFFELGGHSLLATQVVSRIRHAFQVELPLRALFEVPTVAGLTERVEQLQREQEGLVVPPIRPLPRHAPPPLSFAQQRLWFLDQLDPNNSSYNVPYLVRMTGPLRADVLEKSLNEIVRRHETLRTSFQMVDNELVQIIVPALTLPLLHEDLSSLPQAEREDEARRRAAEEVDRPFNLSVAPMLRATLFRLSDDDHVLVLNTHHVISDRWSLGVLSQELACLYEAFAAEHPSPLPELAVQYADYAVWQRDFLSGETLDRQLSYWKQHLSGAPANLDLPTDHLRPPVQTHRGARETVILPLELLDAIRQLSRSEGATLFMTLLTAFNVLLSRYSGQQDVVVGTPIAGRNRAEVEKLIGFFVNTLVMRTDLSGNPSFRELLARVREASMGAYAHQDLPFEKLVEELRPDRDLSRSAIFQVMFVLQNVPTAAQRMGDIEATPFGAGTPSAKFDISLITSETPDGLRVSAIYDTGLFEAETIRRMLGHFHRLLEGAILAPGVPVDRLEMLGTDERQILLEDFNATNHTVPVATLPQLVESQVKRTPDATAVWTTASALSYAELNSRANRLAHHLIRSGVGTESVVGICLERSPDMLVALLAVLKAGAAYLPLDPDYPPERLALMLADAAPTLVISNSNLRQVLPQAAKALLLNEPDTLDTLAKEEAHDPTDADRTRPLRPQHPAYVIYTSGSTGTPKGAVIEHKALVNHMAWMSAEYPVGLDDRVLARTSISFDAAVWELWLPLISGATLCVASEQTSRDPHELLNFMDRAKVTVAQFVPTLLSATCETGRPKPQSLRMVFAGGEALTRDLAQKIVSEWGLPIVNLYGPTETTIQVTHYCCRSEVPDSSTIPIGSPIWNTRIYILDAHLQPVPLGVAGELFVAGDSLGRGYLRRPEITAERFVQDPHGTEPGGRMYRTGDLARWRPNGVLEYLGRADHQVKLRGFRIELGEIESLLSQHPSVGQVVVVFREDSPGDQRLVAYIVPKLPAYAASPEQYGAARAPSRMDPSALRIWVRERLPEFMLPGAWVEMASLPLLPNGKVDRKGLPLPDYGRPDLAAVYHEPRTPTEEVMASIWAEVLRIDQVGVHDQFFELGGHSLLATQVVSRIRQSFRVELPLRALFEAPTVAGLAGRVKQLQREQDGLLIPPIRPLLRHAPPPLSFAQQRLWFLDRLDPHSSTYNVPYMVRMTGHLRAQVLEKSLNEIVRRHETLRTSFQMVNDELVQVVAPDLTLPLVIEDLSSLPQSDREAEARRRATEEVSTPFDLSVAPMLRANLLRLADDDHVLILNTHHIISDGWSLGVLSQELSALYEAFAANQSSPLPELPVQYADYAVWQREFLAGETLDRQLAYWKQHLAGAPASLDLPTDHPRPPVQTYCGARESVVLSAELLDSIRQLCRNEGVTLFMTLLAACNVLLARYCGQADVVIGTPIAGRNRAEVERLIGFFVNTLVMRTDLSGNPSFRELLGLVREAAMGAYAHQDLPFEKLVEEIKPDRELSRNPLFQVMFILQNVPTAGQRIGDIQATPFGSGAPSSKFDISLIASETPEGLRVSANYNTDLFEAETIQRMLGHYRCLLEAAVATPATQVFQMPLLTAEERRQILVEWNDTDKEFPRNRSLYEFFEEQVERTPDSIAVVFESQQLTYGELNARANQLAHYLIKHGAGPEVLVGIHSERSAEMLVGILGILKSGSAYVPLDPKYPKERIHHILNDAHAPIVVTQSLIQNDLPDFEGRRICLDSDWPAISQESPTNPAVKVASDNLAYVLFTSGSTGRPKGVAIEHHSAAAFVDWAQDVFSPKELSGVLLSTSICFDLSVFEIFAPLSTGGKVILADNALHLPTLAARYEVTLINTVPSAMAELLHLRGVPDSVKTVNLAGEALPDALVELIYANTRAERVNNLYGPTEDTTYSTFTQVRRGTPVTIGGPIANSQAYILDAQLNPVPIGVPGELYLAGEGLARGYYGQSDLTSERFVTNHFSTVAGARMYRTSDLARFRHDGNIEYLGRMDHQVKLRGFRIELGEIETVLASHPSVVRVVVVVREDRPAEKRLVAYVVLKPELDLNPTELRAHLERSLPDYMVPGVFVRLDALPLTDTGKINRRALPAPEWSHLDAGSKADPSDQLELIISRIWERVLGVSHVGVADNFFDLGGHSLLAFRLLAEIEKVVGRKIPLASIFRGSTVGSLAKLLREGSESDPEPLVVEFQSGKGISPPFFAVAEPGVRTVGYALLARHMGEDQAFYKLQAPGVRIKDRPLDMSELRTLARQYVAGMRALQRHGPYLIAAMCGGCQIAEQMILQLESQGEEVALFAIFDTWVQEHAHRKWGWRLLGYHQRLLWFAKASLRERMDWLKRALGSRVRIITGKAKATQPWVEAYWPKDFQPPRFHAPIVLFKRPKQPYYYIDDPQMGWGARSQGGVEMHDLYADHHEVLREPHVQIVSKVLLARLRSSSADAPGPAINEAAASPVAAMPS